MQQQYEISFDIPQRIAPHLANFERVWTVQNILLDKKEVDDEGYFLYKVNHHPKAYWVQFKYMYVGSSNPMEIGIVMRTNNGMLIDIAPTIEREQANWNTLHWPIPSMDYKEQNQGIYFRVKPAELQFMKFLRLKLLGFTDLFPESSKYILKEQQFIIRMEQEEEVGQISNPEPLSNSFGNEFISISPISYY